MDKVPEAINKPKPILRIRVTEVDLPPTSWWERLLMYLHIKM